MNRNISQESKDLVVPVIVDLFKRNINNPVSNNNIRLWVLYHTGISLRPCVTRTLIHEIRVHSKVENLIANSHGYFISDNLSVVQGYLSSLQDRAMKIHELQYALKFQMEKNLVGQTSLPVDVLDELAALNIGGSLCQG